MLIDNEEKPDTNHPVTPEIEPRRQQPQRRQPNPGKPAKPKVGEPQDIPLTTPKRAML